jgi:hypothetical protein
MSHRYLKRWRKNESAAVSLALCISSSDEDAEVTQVTSVVNDDSCEIDSDDCFIPEYIESSGSECDYYENYEISETDKDIDGEVSNHDADGDTNMQSLEADLSQWAVRNNITRNAVNELLHILRCNGHALPKDARTLLKTPRCTPSVKKCGGEYVYFGIEAGILNVLAQYSSLSRDCDSVSLLVNVDGLPIHKSSVKEFWPILCAFDKCTPFIVALYYGQGKPSDVNEYLYNFLEEYKKLKQTGVHFNGKILGVDIKAIVCDAPARQYLKCIKGHAGFQACERCTVQGTRKENRTVMSVQPSCKPRTEQEFANFAYKGAHQLSISPLVAYGISCIESFVLDYMHVICLGVVRRILFFFRKGPRNCRLSSVLASQLLQFIIIILILAHLIIHLQY